LKLNDEQARIGAVMCSALAWLSLGIFAEQVHAAADGTPVNQEAIVVSLPVFAVSLIGSVSFTWVIAQWDAKRSRRLENLERQLIERGLVKPDEEQE